MTCHDCQMMASRCQPESCTGGVVAGAVVLALLGGLTALLILRRDRRRKVAALVRLSCKAG